VDSFNLKSATLAILVTYQLSLFMTSGQKNWIGNLYMKLGSYIPL
jgi:hypothetical protein